MIEADTDGKDTVYVSSDGEIVWRNSKSNAQLDRLQRGTGTKGKVLNKSTRLVFYRIEWRLNLFSLLKQFLVRQYINSIFISNKQIIKRYIRQHKT